MIFVALVVLQLPFQTVFSAFDTYDNYMVTLKGHLINQNFEEAAKYFEKINTLVEGNEGLELPSSYYYYMAETSSAVGQYEKAMTAVEKYISQEGESGRFYSRSLFLIDIVDVGLKEVIKIKEIKELERVKNIADYNEIFQELKRQLENNKPDIEADTNFDEVLELKVEEQGAMCDVIMTVYENVSNSYKVSFSFGEDIIDKGFITEHTSGTGSVALIFKEKLVESSEFPGHKYKRLDFNVKSYARKIAAFIYGLDNVCSLMKQGSVKKAINEMLFLTSE